MQNTSKENDLFRWESFSKAKERLSNIIQGSTSLIVDYIRAIYMRSSFYNLQPLTPRQELMASEITNPIFLGIIQDMNRQMQPRQKTITKKFTICEAPQVPEKELLTALIARHKGKVQFIDFWATWCGGCRQIIKEYEPLKKEIGEDKVAFIYLTGPSSIKKDLGYTNTRHCRRTLLVEQRTVGLSLESFSDDGITDVPDNR